MYLWYGLMDDSFHRICISYCHRPAVHFVIVVHSGCSVPFFSVLVVRKQSVLITKVHRKPKYSELPLHWISNSTKYQRTLGCFHAKYQTRQENCTHWAVPTPNTWLYRKSEHPALFPQSTPNSIGNMHILGCYHNQHQILQETCIPWAVFTITTKFYRKSAHPGLFLHTIPNSTGNLHNLGCFHNQHQVLQDICTPWTLHNQYQILQETCVPWTTFTFSIIKQTCGQSSCVVSISENQYPVPETRRRFGSVHHMRRDLMRIVMAI